MEMLFIGMNADVASGFGAKTELTDSHRAWNHE